MTDAYHNGRTSYGLHDLPDTSTEDTASFDVDRSLSGDLADRDMTDRDALYPGDVDDAGHRAADTDTWIRVDQDDWADVAGFVEPRSYVLTAGRTHPSRDFDMLSVVAATSGPRTPLNPPYDLLLDLCTEPVSVAEISARAELSVTVTKILLSDLVDINAVTTRMPAFDDPNVVLLERVLDGLRRFTA